MKPYLQIIELDNARRWRSLVGSDCLPLVSATLHHAVHRDKPVLLAMIDLLELREADAYAVLAQAARLTGWTAEQVAAFARTYGGVGFTVCPCCTKVFDEHGEEYFPQRWMRERFGSAELPAAGLFFPGFVPLVPPAMQGGPR